MSAHQYDPSYTRDPERALCVVCGQPARHTNHPTQLAHARRQDATQTLQHIRAGHMTIEQALTDPRANGLRLIDLFTASPSIGRVYGQMLCDDMRLSELKPVGALVARQRRVIVARINRLRRVA